MKNPSEVVIGLRWLTVLGLCTLGGLAPLSCGGTSKTGTDSHTHWLAQCTSNDDCGSLSCVCGVCSRECDAEADCSGLDGAAACRTPRSCEQAKQSVTACQKTCETQQDCRTLAPDQVCYRGHCEKASAVPPEPAICAAMDAQSNGDDCLPVVGYTFDGVTCRPVVCGCTGEDCGSLYESLQACDDAHAECYAERGVSRSCEVNSDCVLSARQCCPAPTDLDSVLAVTVESAAPFQQALCEGVDDCPGIHIPAKPSLYALCVEGQCEALDVAEIAGCSMDADCDLQAKDCCGCGVQPGADWLAASSSYAEFAACDVACDLCIDEPPQGLTATCDPNFGLCALTRQ